VQLLLLRTLRNWNFAKGTVEAGKQPVEVALREVAEETCIVDPQFIRGDYCIETCPYSKSKVALYYLAITEIALVTSLANRCEAQRISRGYH